MFPDYGNGEHPRPGGRFAGAVALYNATSGPSWSDNSGWLQDPISTWIGVMVADGRVSTLALAGNNLMGTIPTEIGQLTNLTELHLGGNQLTSAIPPEVGDLTNLTRLILDVNQLTGAIPPEFG